MNRAIQEIVNAQIDVNRAVFEANKSKSNDQYLLECIASAQEYLAAASKVLLGVRRRQNDARDRRTALSEGHVDRKQKRAERIAFVESHPELSDAALAQAMRHLYSPKTYVVDIQSFISRMRARTRAASA